MKTSWLRKVAILSVLAGAFLMLSQCLMLIPRPIPGQANNTVSNPGQALNPPGQTVTPAPAPRRVVIQQAYPKGSIAVITGRVRVERGTYLIEDENSDGIFVFTVIARDDANALSRLVGRRIQVRLKVVAFAENNRITANFMEVMNGSQVLN
jgi:hypothetical protein